MKFQKFAKRMISADVEQQEIIELVAVGTL